MKASIIDGVVSGTIVTGRCVCEGLGVPELSWNKFGGNERENGGKATLIEGTRKLGSSKRTRHYWELKIH